MKKSLFWQLFFPILGVVLVILLAIGWYIPSLAKQQAEASALAQAEKTVAQFKTLRAYYTKNVISKVVGKGELKGSVNHKNEANSIPLPATMIHDLGEALQKEGTSLKLYSAYPFPNRANRILDDFQNDAWRAINQSPDKPYYRTVETASGTSVRVGIADFMVADACVACHNSHPETPKADWAMGDVRGILEIEAPIDDQLAAGFALGRSIVLTIIAGTLILFAALYLVYRNNIGKRLDHVANALSEISQGDGDLSRRLDASGEHEISRIGKAFNTFADHLADTVSHVQETSSELTSLSSGLTQSSIETSAKASLQENETQQVATAVTEMDATATEIAASAKAAASATEDTSAATQQGEASVAQSMEATRRLSEDIGIAADALSQLQADSQNISGVLDVIRGVAEQTNLLALNAAIEAARAGEQGRGFAVVADEVRTLAARTQESTQEIQEMTERLSVATDKVVTAMGKSRDQADATMELASNVGTQLQQIRESVDTLRMMSTQIASAATEQGTVVSDVNRSLTGISDAAAAVSSSGEHTKQLSDGVDRLSSRLQELTGHFKLP